MIKNNIMIGNAEIHFRNFSGKAGTYNAEGNRNFCVFLEDDQARTLQEDGWNVRWLQPRDDQETPRGYLQVAVGFNKFPPKILLLSSRGRTLLDDKSVNTLDLAEYKQVDLVIRPYNWTLYEGTKNEKHGVKAYVKDMYVTIVEDEFELKYNNAPDSAADAIGGCGNCDACDGHCKQDHD